MTDMLDFLGMREEADMMVLFLWLLGIAAGIGLGFLMLGKQDSWKKYVFYTIGGLSTAAGVVAFGFVCISGLIQLITFRWGELLKAALIGCVPGYLLFYLLYNAVFSIRLRKYKRNPLLKKIAAYCVDNQIVGIQCFEDQVRFFSALEGTDYCKTDSVVIHEQSYRGSISSDYSDIRPATWKCYDNPASLRSVLVFADQNYPKLPDVDVFATALAAKLGGCKVASHATSFVYHYSRYNKSSGERELVNHTVHTYKDAFVYKKSALKQLQNSQKAREKAFLAERKATEKNANRWE